MGREGFPEEVIDPETVTKAIVHAATGLEKLNAIDGVDPVSLASIQLNAGGQCVGNLGQYMGVPEHSEVAEKIVGTAREAVEAGNDPVEAVADKLSFFVKRDENGQLLRSGTEELTVIQSTLGNRPAGGGDLAKKKDNSPELTEKKPLLEPQSTPKKEIAKKLVSAGATLYPKSHRTTQKIAAAQAELLRQQSHTAHPQQVHKTKPKPSVTEKILSTKPKLVDEPENIAKPIPLVKNTSEYHKTRTNTEIAQEPIIFVAENIDTLGWEEVEQTKTFPVVAEPMDPAVDITEVIGELDPEAVHAAQTSDNETLQLEPDEFGTIEVGKIADTDYDGLLAELPPWEFELPHILREGEAKEEAPEQLIVSRQIAERIQTLEPVRAEEATPIFEIILEKIQQVQESIEEISEIKEPEAVRQDLEILCARLLMCMDVKPTAERINYLLQTLMIEVQEQVSSAIKETEDQGTHEHKQDIGLLMTDWRTWMDESLAHAVGQYAVQLTAPNPIGYNE